MGATLLSRETHSSSNTMKNTEIDKQENSSLENKVRYFKIRYAILFSEEQYLLNCKAKFLKCG